MTKYIAIIILIALPVLAFSAPEKRSSNSSLNIENTQISGITVINGKLWIDGHSVPYNTKTFKSPNTGSVYSIKWGAENNISVEEKK